jgi:hypothetical protein
MFRGSTPTPEAIKQDLAPPNPKQFSLKTSAKIRIKNELRILW